MAHVPYKGGAPAVADLVGGQVQMYFGNASELLPHIRAGKLTVLGVSTARRSRELPDVPTIAETYPGFLTYTLNGLLLPSGTPRDIQERVAQEMARMARDPVAIDRIHRTGSDPSSIGLGDFAELLRREQPLWIEAVKSAGIKPE
jgi:tripartite-type tricarboxylate transporter receptor subunit TctC